LVNSLEQYQVPQKAAGITKPVAQTMHSKNDIWGNILFEEEGECKEIFPGAEASREVLIEDLANVYGWADVHAKLVYSPYNVLTGNVEDEVFESE